MASVNMEKAISQDNLKMAFKMLDEVSFVVSLNAVAILAMRAIYIIFICLVLYSILYSSQY